MAPLRILVIEYPRPSTRTVRFIDTFRSLGAEVAYLDHSDASEHPELIGCRRIDVPAASIVDRIRARFGIYPRHEPAVPPVERLGRGLPSTKRWWYRATAAIRRERPDLYWAADLDALPVATWARAARGGGSAQVPIVFDMHELWADQGGLPEEQVPTWREISRRFIPTVSRLVTVSQEFIDDTRREHPGVAAEVILSLAPDVAPLATEGIHAALGIPAGAPIAVHIGATVANRNPDLGVRALQYLPEHHLVFDGTTSDSMLEHLNRLAANLGLSGRVHATNSAPRARLEALLEGCSVNLVLYGPSQSTKNQLLVLPNKVFDGLAAGLPTVAAAGTATGDYLLREGLGTTFVADDPASLADAIRRAEALALRAAVTARRSSFHWSANRPAIAALLDSIADGRAERESR
jgi:glycosyltransferase involved in cell wall biosynthesis